MMRNFFKGSSSNENQKSSSNPNNATNSNSNMDGARVSSKYDSNNQPSSQGVGNNATSLNAKITNQIIQSPQSHIKPGSATLQHKTGKAANLNQPAYMLPATQQSRSLQNQHAKHSNNMHSTPHLIGGKQAGNLTAHHQSQHEGLHPSKQPSHGQNIHHHYTGKPDSGQKKRTSFLLHGQTNGSNSQNPQHSQSQQSFQHYHPTLQNNKYPSTIIQTQKKTQQPPNNKSLNDMTGGEQSSMQNQTDHELSKQYNQTNNQSNTAEFTTNSQIVTSPPKRVGQTRKPSGKSTKSNRAGLQKKQLITNHSGLLQNMQQANQNQAQMKQSIFQQEKNYHESATGATNNPQTQGSGVIGPQLSSQSAYQAAKNQMEYQAMSGSQQPRSQSTQQMDPSNSMGKYQTNLQSSKEHGAVAAVVQQTQNMSLSGQVTSDGVNYQNYDANNQMHANPGASQSTLSKSQQSNQQFLPNIGPQTSTNSNQNVQSSNNMYNGSSSISPYQSIEEFQNGMIPANHPQTTNNAQYQQMNQNTQNDYFNLKSVHSTRVGQNSQGQSIRSTSQPHHVQNQQPHSLMTSKANNLISASQQALPGQGSFVGQSSVVPGSREASAQSAKERDSKVNRASSEPPQPMLKSSESTNSFMENYRQRVAFTLTMKAMMVPKGPKIQHPEGSRTEAQTASQQVRDTVAKLLQKNQPQATLPFFQTSKVSSKAFGAVKAFAANTNVGIVRKANEDRISIILNVIQPATKTPKISSDKWPKLQIFGVYDGHGGSKCAEYLKDNLHNNIILQPEFPKNIPEAIKKGSYKTEEEFLNLVCPSPDQPHNKAGSCAIVILVINEDIYVLNVGDSRALCSVSEHPTNQTIYAKANQASKESLHSQPANGVMQFSMEATSKVKALSTDHKPSNPDEYKRIVDNGGYVYQTQTVMKNGMPTTQTQQVKQESCPPPEDSDDEDNPFVGPYRVFPGRLSVCRTFGDCEAKIAFLGGTKGVVNCEPEIIHEHEGVHNLDYVLICSDGIFDKLKNDQINQIVWDITTKERQKAYQQNKLPSIHTISGLVSDEILHASARHRSLDNLSIVFIAFQRFSDYINAFQKEVTQPGMPAGETDNNQALNSQISQSKLQPLSQMNMNRTPQRVLQRTKISNTQQIGTSQSTQPNDVMNGPNIHKDSSGNMPKNILSQFQSEQQSKTHNPLGSSSSQYKLDQAQNNQSQSIHAYSNQIAPHTTTGQTRPLSLGNNGSQSMQNLNQKPNESVNSSQKSTIIDKSGSQYSSIYTSKLRNDQRVSGVLGNMERPNSRGIDNSRKGIRSRKSNNVVQNGSHSQDSRPTLPPMQMQKQQNTTAAGSKIAYNQFAESKNTMQSSSTSNLIGQGPQSSGSQPQNPSNYISNPSVQQPYTTDAMRPNGSANQQRRTGLFKVNTQSQLQNTNQSSVGQMMPGIKSQVFKSNQGNGANAQIGSSQGNLIIGGDRQGSKIILDGQGSSSIVNSSKTQNAQNLRKKMKPYKSSQTRRMPDNTSSIQKYSSSNNSKDIQSNQQNPGGSAAAGSTSQSNTYNNRY